MFNTEHFVAIRDTNNDNAMRFHAALALTSNDEERRDLQIEIADARGRAKFATACLAYEAKLAPYALDLLEVLRVAVVNANPDAQWVKEANALIKELAEPLGYGSAVRDAKRGVNRS
jgi:hypothetical protein